MDTDTSPVTQVESNIQTANNQQAAYRGEQSFLTPAMQAFAEHWAYNHNQIKAHQHAYPSASLTSSKSEARRLFHDPRVQAEIQRVIDRWTDLSAVTLNRIEHELARVAFSDVRMLCDKSGDLLLPHQWDADTAAAVASYTETNVRGVITRKVRLADKHAANRTLAEMKGAFDKNKAPPGIRASFTINLGNGPVTLGAAPNGRTIEARQVKPARIAAKVGDAPNFSPVSEPEVGESLDRSLAETGQSGIPAQKGAKTEVGESQPEAWEADQRRWADLAKAVLRRRDQRAQ